MLEQEMRDKYEKRATREEKGEKCRLTNVFSFCRIESFHSRFWIALISSWRISIEANEEQLWLFSSFFCLMCQTNLSLSRLSEIQDNSERQSVLIVPKATCVSTVGLKSFELAFGFSSSGENREVLFDSSRKIKQSDFPIFQIDSMWWKNKKASWNLSSPINFAITILVKRTRSLWLDK